MKQVSFQSANTTISGVLSGPAGRGVVLCHGLISTKDSKTSLFLEKLLNEAGIMTLRFDFYGHGASGGAFEDLTSSIGVENTLCALDFLKAQGCTKIGIMGSSFGGFVAIQAAARSDILALALKCPVSDWSNVTMAVDITLWKKKGIIDVFHKPLKYGFYEDGVKVDVRKIAPNIHAPTLIVHGSADPLVPLTQSQNLATHLPRSLLLEIDGADHQFSNEEDYTHMVQSIADFLIEHVR